MAKICKLTYLCGNIQILFHILMKVLSPKLLVFNSNSIWKIMERRLAVDVAAAVMIVDVIGN